MERQNIAVRKDCILTPDEKMEIAKENGFRCAHCGTKTYPRMCGGRGTIDHYVPLAKGGVNQKIDYVYLCEACNKEKATKILNPDQYLNYIRPERLKELNGYFQDYLDGFEYAGRNNILACDEYEFRVPLPMFWNASAIQRMKKRNCQTAFKSYALVHMTEEDREAVTEFYKDYLRKYNLMANEEVAVQNIEFWEQFGAIYGVYDSQSSLRALVPIVISSASNMDPIFTMCVFSPYTDKMTKGMSSVISMEVAKMIAKERRIAKIRIAVLVPSADPASSYVTKDGGYSVHKKDDMFRIAYQGFSFDAAETDRKIRGFENTVKKNIREDFDQFFETHDYQSMDWMPRMIDPEYHYEKRTDALVLPFRSVPNAAAAAVNRAAAI